MRAYRQFCGIAKALDIVGGRWSLLIVRELLPGPRRYSDLRSNLAGITPNLLAERLRHLQHAGVVESVPSKSGNRRAWGLTPWGRTLEPALLALGAFGANRMTNVVGHRTSGRWFAISLQRRYHGDLPPTAVALVIDGEPYSLAIDGDQLVTRDGFATDPQITLRGSLAAIAETLLSDRPTPDSVGVEGDGRLLRTLRAALRPGRGKTGWDG